MNTCDECEKHFMPGAKESTSVCPGCAHGVYVRDDVDALVRKLWALSLPEGFHWEMGWPLETGLVQGQTHAKQKPGYTIRWSFTKHTARRNGKWKKLSGPSLRPLLQAALWFEELAAEFGDERAMEWYEETGGTARPKGI